MPHSPRAAALAFAVTALWAASAHAQERAKPPPLVPPLAVATPPRLPGYLTADDTPDTFRILAPAPQAGSPARAEDVAAFRETRKLIGTPRWALAQSDVDEGRILEGMTCALGAALTPENAPHLFRLRARMGRDAGRITSVAKDQFKQTRPFLALGDKDAICSEDQRDGLRKSLSYPSGHSTWSWSIGLVLAEAAPDRAQPIMARARAFGESRVVCGVHWVSDITEGRTNGSILVSVLHANPEFVADLAEAKLEIAAARKAQAGAPVGDPERCKLEADASAHTPWTR